LTAPPLVGAPCDALRRRKGKKCLEILLGGKFESVKKDKILKIEIKIVKANLGYTTIPAGSK
jgi:hypothetical protein